MKLGVYENMNLGEFGCGGGVGRMKNMIKIQCIKLIHKYIKKTVSRKANTNKEVSSSLPIKKERLLLCSPDWPGIHYVIALPQLPQYLG